MENWFIAFDIDDTLITDEGDISTDLKGVLKSLQTHNTLLFSSGRPPESIKNIVRHIGLDLETVYVCAFNGSLLTRGSKELYSHTVGGADMDRLVEFYREYNLHVQSYEDSTIIHEVDNEYTELERVITQSNIKKVDNITAYKRSYPKMMGLGHAETVKYAISNMPEDLTETFHSTISKPYFLETMAKGVSKGTAIDYFINNKIASFNKTMAFGDSFNDIEMLQKVNYSVAVNNAHSEVKHVAEYITHSNNEDGVYHYLNQFMNGGTI